MPSASPSGSDRSEENKAKATKRPAASQGDNSAGSGSDSEEGRCHACMWGSGAGFTCTWALAAYAVCAWATQVKGG